MSFRFSAVDVFMTQSMARRKKLRQQTTLLHSCLYQEGVCELTAVDSSTSQSLVRVPDDVSDFLWHPTMSKQPPSDALSTLSNTFSKSIKLTYRDEFHLFQDEAQSYDLVHA